MLEAKRISETLVNYYRIKRRCIPEHSQLHTQRREHLKSRITKEDISGSQGGEDVRQWPFRP
jgi:hypothetical protein